MPLMMPPKEAKHVEYNGTKVGADGVEVLELDVEALAAEGWTLAEAPKLTTEEDDANG